MRNNLFLFALVAISTFMFSDLQAQNWWNRSIKAEGPIVKKKLNIDDFDAFTLSTTGNVYIKQGSTQSVEVESHENVIENLKTNVSNKHWKIDFEKNMRNIKKLNFYITVKSLAGAYISGSGDITGSGTFNGGGNLGVGISGSGNIKLSANAGDVSASIAGSGDIVLSGEAQDMEVKIAGSGDIDAYDMVANSCSVSISGSGDVKVYANDELNVRSSGSGDVYYKGRPRVSSKISGSGAVSSRQ